MARLKNISDKIQRVAKKQKNQPGKETEMYPQPITQNNYKGSEKLLGKVAVITGGDSGIGHAVAVLFAKEGADIVVSYLDEDEDAQKVKREIEELGRKCLLVKGDIGNQAVCEKIISKTIAKLGKIDILVNNAAEQHVQTSIENITAKQLIKTFSTNIFSYFYMVKAALPHLQNGATIINTTSVTCYKGSKDLIDYSATKGAIVAFTRSLSQSLVEKGIRVNGVAPGPIWTPLIPASFGKEKLKKFGDNVPMQRMGQPTEVATSYVFLAADDSSYMTGQVLHPNGGVIVNG